MFDDRKHLWLDGGRGFLCGETLGSPGSEETNKKRGNTWGTGFWMFFFSRWPLFSLFSMFTPKYRGEDPI